jgi:predicted permease
LKAPLFTALAVASLALGIGANTSIFTLLDQVVLRPLPVERPGELVQVRIRGTFNGNSWGDGTELSYPMYLDFRDNNKVFAGMFARFDWAMHVDADGSTERISGELVSGTYFPVLGVRPAQGRLLSPDDDRAVGANPVAVLSHSYWKARFSGNPGVVGRKITINGHPFTVVGVAERGFSGIDVGAATQVFVPMMMKPQLTPRWNLLDDRRSRFARVFARLRPGVTPEQAEAGLQPFFRELRERELREPYFAKVSAYNKQEFLQATIEVVPSARGHSGLHESLTRPLWILMAIVAGVLLIACANVAGLLVARGMSRQREIAIRFALGGSRRRIVGQLLVESVILAALGAVGGVMVATWGSSLLLGLWLDPDAAAGITASPDARVLAFSLALALLTSMAFGLVPALQATKPSLAPTLKEQASSVAGGGQVRLRKGLVIVQVALSLLLLIGAGLFVRSLANLLAQNPGFEVTNLVTFVVDPSLNAYTPAHTKRLATTLVERISSVPGVTGASLAGIPILHGGSWSSSMTVEGYAAKPDEDVVAFNNTVMPGYFATMRIPLLLGRDFRPGDVRSTPAAENEPGFRVAIANRRFVERYFRGTNPVGRHVGFGSGPAIPTPIEIIGVVGTSKYVGIRDDAEPQLFFPLLEDNTPGSLVAYVRATQSPTSLFATLRRTVRDIDPGLPIFNMRTMEAQVARSLVNERVVAGLSAVLGVLATLLAVVGLYGVMAYTVTLRTREVGIRMALGALSRGVAWLFVREAAILVAIGFAIAVPGLWAFGRYVQSQLYGVGAIDVTTIVLAMVGLGAAAAAGALVPALRASRIDPLAALREG